MKKSIKIICAIVLLSSCSSKLTKEEQQQQFKEVGQSYITKKVESWDKKQRKGLKEIELLKVDSVIDMSDKGSYQMDINLKYAEWNRQIEYANKLADVEKSFGIEPTESTLYEFSKADKIVEEIKQMEAELNNKSKTKTGDLVYFLAKLVNEDGSTQKIQMPIVFNNDLTVSAEAMNKIFD